MNIKLWNYQKAIEPLTNNTTESTETTNHSETVPEKQESANEIALNDMNIHDVIINTVAWVIMCD